MIYVAVLIGAAIVAGVFVSCTWIDNTNRVNAKAAEMEARRHKDDPNRVVDWPSTSVPEHWFEQYQMYLPAVRTVGVNRDGREVTKPTYRPEFGTFE